MCRSAEFERLFRIYRSVLADAGPGKLRRLDWYLWHRRGMVDREP
jgi:hypothetical protein